MQIATIIYGISPSTDMFLSSSYNTGNNIFACTNGKEYYKEIEAISLHDLEQLDDKMIDRIVICSEFVSDILKSLFDIGIKQDKCFFFNHMSETLIPCSQLSIPSASSENTLFAFYDLGCNLPCYDVTTFLVLAEQERKNQRKQYIKFIIVPDRSEKQSGINVYHSHHDTKWRIEKIIKPIFSTVPSYIATDELISKKEIDLYKKFQPSIFPTGYFENQRARACDLALLKHYKESKIDISSISAPPKARELVLDYIRHHAGQKRVITITLREYWANPDHRNSQLEEWANFILSLDRDIYWPVIIRDTYKCTQPLPKSFSGIESFPVASIDLHMRFALYQQAHINLGVENGPIYPISFMKGVRSIVFRRQSENIPCLSSRTNEIYSFKVGKNHYFYDNDFQVTAWCDDICENILNEFYTLEKKITLEESNIKQEDVYER